MNVRPYFGLFAIFAALGGSASWAFGGAHAQPQPQHEEPAAAADEQDPLGPLIRYAAAGVVAGLASVIGAYFQRKPVKKDNEETREALALSFGTLEAAIDSRLTAHERATSESLEREREALKEVADKNGELAVAAGRMELALDHLTDRLDEVEQTWPPHKREERWKEKP